MSSDAVLSKASIATLRVRDWHGMVSHYRDHLGLKQLFADELTQYAMFDAGPLRLAIEGPARTAVPKTGQAGALLLNFEVPSLESALAELRRRGALGNVEVQYGPGYDYVAIEDPEYNQHIVYQRTAAT